MMKERESLLDEAVDRLIIQTGYIEETLDCPPTYFAEIELLGIKSSHFTEEEAVGLVKTEARFILEQRFSLVKKILDFK